MIYSFSEITGKNHGLLGHYKVGHGTDKQEKSPTLILDVLYPAKVSAHLKK